MSVSLQGLGAPACAKLLTQWYSSSERGTAWSIWTASNNVGGFAAPWIAGTAAGMLGWRWGMWIPGFVALSIASIIVFTITDKPQDRGFKAVEVVKNKNQTNGKKESAKGPSVKEILVQDVLSNPWVWLFAFAYFFTYAIRQGTSSWFVHYLMNVKGITDLPAAAAQVSGLEIGGFFGAISAGVLSYPHCSSTLYRRTTKKCSSWTEALGVLVTFVGNLVTDAILSVRQRLAVLLYVLQHSTVPVSPSAISFQRWREGASQLYIHQVNCVESIKICCCALIPMVLQVVGTSFPRVPCWLFHMDTYQYVKR